MSLFFDPFSGLINRLIINNRARHTPNKAGVDPFVIATQDNVSIAGWCMTPPAPCGTLFMLHGFTGHCGLPSLCDQGFRLAEEFNLGLFAHDARHHGHSGNRLFTFGTAEMWDFQAVLTEAERRGFPGPFIAIGDSLGAMTAQRTAITDPRIRGAFLMHPPGWPYDALGVCLGGGAVHAAALAINCAYGWNILRDGDIRQHSGSPSHNPLILCIMGDRDHYGWEKTREIYDHWYRDYPERDGKSPCREPEARKWFVLVPGATHPGSSFGYHVWDWPDYSTVLHDFIRRCLE